MEQVLPFDIIPHILSRLPVKTLMKFKCVCREWFSIIESPYFARLHSNQSQPIQETRVLLPFYEQQKLLNPCKDDGRFMHISLDLVSNFFKSKSYYLVGSCNELLCFKKLNCYGGKTGLLLLFNPLRQQLLPLPSPSVKPAKFVLGFDSSTTTYKILTLFYEEISTAFDDEPRYRLGAEVFSLGIRTSSSSSWRAISNVPQFLLALQHPVFTCGALHWVTDDSLLAPETSYSKKIVAFHVGKEEFSFIAWPDTTIGFPEKYHLVELRGCLCFVHSSVDYINIWIMKNNGRKVEDWAREYRIHITTPEIFYHPTFVMQVIGQWEDEEILLRYSSCFVAYNPRTDKLSCIHIPSSDDCDIGVFYFTFTGSLISLSGFQAAEQIDSSVEA